MILGRKMKSAKKNLSTFENAFTMLDATVPEDLRQIWMHQETKALAEQLSNPKAMDIYDVQLEKGKPNNNDVQTFLNIPSKHPPLNQWRWIS